MNTNTVSMTNTTSTTTSTSTSTSTTESINIINITKTTSNRKTISELLECMSFINECAQTPSESALIRESIMQSIFDHIISGRTRSDELFLSQTNASILDGLYQFRETNKQLMEEHLAFAERVTNHEIFEKFPQLNNLCRSITDLSEAPYRKSLIPGTRSGKIYKIKKEILSLISKTKTKTFVTKTFTINDNINEHITDIINSNIDSNFKPIFSSEEEFIVSTALYVVLSSTLSDIVNKLNLERKETSYN